MPNLRILDSRDLRRGDSDRFPVQFLKTVLNLSWDVFCNGISGLIGKQQVDMNLIPVRVLWILNLYHSTFYVWWKTPCEFHFWREVTYLDQKTGLTSQIQGFQLPQNVYEFQNRRIQLRLSGCRPVTAHACSFSMSCFVIAWLYKSNIDTAILAVNLCIALIWKCIISICSC